MREDWLVSLRVRGLVGRSVGLLGEWRVGGWVGGCVGV